MPSANTSASRLTSRRNEGYLTTAPPFPWSLPVVAIVRPPGRSRPEYPTNTRSLTRFHVRAAEYREVARSVKSKGRFADGKRPRKATCPLRKRQANNQGKQMARTYPASGDKAGGT